LALGVAFNDGSVGGVIFSPFWIALIDRIGFPAAALVVSAAMLATLGALAGFVLTRTPESLNQAPDGSPSTASDLPAGATVETAAAAPAATFSAIAPFLRCTSE
jgi:hypothetical protein